MRRLAGKLIAVEGIDQAGKRTVCERLVDELSAAGLTVELTGFPDDGTPIGEEIQRFLAGERSYPAHVRQLLFAANRWERAEQLRAWLSSGTAVVVDRYVASGLAYGAALGLAHDWMECVERDLPRADLTILLDIPPELSLARKSEQRDLYEAEIDVLRQARGVYLRLADRPATAWRTIDGTTDRETVWSAVFAAVRGFAEHL